MSRRTALVAVIALAFAACGGGEGGGSGTSQPSTTVPPTTALPPTTTLPPVNGSDDIAIGTIDITIEHPDADTVSYTIGCTGDAFPVTPEIEGVDGAAACEQLADPDVLDRLVNGAPQDQVCTEIYGGPDVATITGEINGQTIDTTIDRTNGCGIDEWDTLLSEVLPPALGVQG